jgi:YVTN family beta-propeller protein
VLVVIKGDDRYAKVDPFSAVVLQRDVLDRAARNVPLPNDSWVARARRAITPPDPNDWLGGRQVQSQVPVLSPDSSRLYLITATGRDARAVRDRIDVLDAYSLDRVQTIRLSHPCVSATISADGRELYVVDTLRSAIRVIDATTGSEVRTISDVGTRPVFAVVVP